MKNDSYLNLCVEQAQHSPLHYRHGAIVVKGGKVIGQGYNDYRIGFDGGSILKSGVLPKAAAADSTLPDKNSAPSAKLKPKFTPVEAVSGNCGGGGHHANTRLSMHSEMMAINSALTSAHTLAASTLQHIKPLSPPTSAPSASRLRPVLPPTSSNDVPARLRPTSGVLNCPHLDATAYYQDSNNAKEAHQQNTQRQKLIQNQNHHVHKEKAAHHPDSRHHKHGPKSKQYSKYKQYKSYKKLQNRPQIDHFSQRDDDTDDDQMHPDTNKAAAVAGSNANTFGQRKARNTHLIVPKGHAGPSSHGVKQRMKNPKLVGADLYVVRLCYGESQPLKRKEFRSEHRPRKATAAAAASASAYVDDDQSDTCSTASNSSNATGSLHDELTCNKKVRAPGSSSASSSSSSSSSSSPSTDPEDARVVAESRPCYRCVSYMHSVGIKRVFWSTSEGKWEGAKVRDLVDQLEGAMATPDGSLGLPVFVTKHEVLLIRRLMLGDES